MIKFYQREECPACTRVRGVMAQLNLQFESIYVSRLGSERNEILQMEGVKNGEVPLMVDQGTIIQGSEEIIQHLKKNYRGSGFGDPKYGLTRVLKGIKFSDAVASTKKALASEGFGILSEIDVKATLKKKLEVDFDNYLILGACNPPLAYQALTEEAALGLFLPCNVVLTEDHNGNAIVSAIDPKQMFKVVENPAMEELSLQVRQKIAAALKKIV